MTTETLERPADEVLDAPKLSAVKVYNPIEQGIQDMLTKHGGVLTTPPDVSTAKGLAEAKANRKEMVTFRTRIEVVRKSEKEESLVYGRLVDSEAKRITAIAAPIEKAYDDAITAEELRIETKRREALEADRLRITALTARIQAIKDVRETANMCRTSDRLKQLIDGMPAYMEPGFEEFQDQALTAFNETCTVLQQLYTVKVDQEAQAAELARQQEELAVRRAEQERLDREAEERRAAQQAEESRKTRLRAKLDAMREIRLQGGLAKTSADVHALIEKLEEPDESFEEALPEAKDLWTAIAGDLADLLDNKLDAEVRAAELAEKEAEAKRVADAEKAAKDAQEHSDAHAQELLAYHAAITTPEGVLYSTTTFKDNGEPIMLNKDGTRSVFCDLTDDMPDPVAPAGQVLSIAAEPARPTDLAIVNAVVAAFNTDFITALEWLEGLDFHELNR